TLNPLRRSERHSVAGGVRSTSPRRLSAIDLIGASELFSSWESTRISRRHACRSSSLRARLTSASTSSWFGRPPWRKVPRRTSHRPRRPGNSRSTTRGASPPSGSASPSSAALLPSSCSGGRPSRATAARLATRRAAANPPANVGRKTLEAMPLEPPIEGAAREAESLGRIAHVPARAGERLVDEYALDFLEAHVVERATPVRRTGQCQVAPADLGALGQQDSALDRVVELAHVARPGVAQQRLERVGGEPEAGFAVAAGV